MRKRKRLLLWVALLVVLGSLGLVGGLWWTAPNHRVGWRGYERIELGMTEQEVEEIVAKPPGWYEPLPEGEFQVYVHEAGAEKGLRDSPKGYSWVSTEGHLGVTFDAKGKVVGASFTPTRRVSPNIFDRIRRWLGL
jgi:hypothetical protein